MDICRAEAQTRRALARSPLRPMPLAVISRGHTEYPTGTLEDAQERLWRRLQRELAAMVPGAHHVIATGSGHDIHQERPGLVLRQIRDVVTAVRDGRSSLSG
jgi:pimeloyl-ACP methyl ester carboxylesterase